MVKGQEANINKHPCIVNSFQDIVSNGTDKDDALKNAAAISGNKLNAHKLTVSHNLI